MSTDNTDITEIGPFNCFTGEHFDCHGQEYRELARVLLDSEPEEAPMPIITVHNVDEPIHSNPGDLTDGDDQRLAVICRIAPEQWERLNLEQRIPWMEEAVGRIDPPIPPAEEAHTPRLTVDLPRKTITFDGTTHDISSDAALRWVKVLSDHPGEWISGPQLNKHDSNLLETKTNRLRRFLPNSILGLIDSETGKGSRIRL